MSGHLSTDPAVRRVSVVNIANLLTLGRLILVPLVALCLLADHGHDTTSRIIAFIIFMVAVLTDQLDGWLARKYGIVTDFGKLADPIADKMLIGVALIVLSVLGDIPWWVTVVILFREVSITLLRFLVLHRGVIPASRGGKIKTLAQTVAIGLFILPLQSWSLFGWSQYWLTVAWVAMSIAIVLTVLTGIDYVMAVLRARRKRCEVYR